MNKSLERTIEKVLSDEENVRTVTLQHQAEFPYGRDDEANVTRRQFCAFLFLTSSAFFAGAAAFAAKAAYDGSKPVTYSPQAIEGASSLAPGSALNFSYPNEGDTAILIRSVDGTYTAFGQKCTHLTCPVYYSKDHDRLECPCHEGGFSARTGDVLYGPPPRPLDHITLEVRDGGVFAVAREVRGNES